MTCAAVSSPLMPCVPRKPWAFWNYPRPRPVSLLPATNRKQISNEIDSLTCAIVSSAFSFFFHFNFLKLFVIIDRVSYSFFLSPSTRKFVWSWYFYHVTFFPLIIRFLALSLFQSADYRNISSAPFERGPRVDRQSFVLSYRLGRELFRQ